MSPVNTKIKVFTLADRKEHRNIVDQSKFEGITYSGRKARENISERVTIGFGFTSDWMKKQREFCKPCSGVRKKLIFT